MFLAWGGVRRDDSKDATMTIPAVPDLWWPTPWAIDVNSFGSVSTY